jgi:hypothetical protein
MRVLLLLAMVGCVIEEFGVGSGTIHVHNDDSAPVDLLIADSTTCFAGTRSSVQPQAIRSFSVAEEAYVCLDEKPPAIKVVDGARYAIRGGALVKE